MSNNEDKNDKHSFFYRVQSGIGISISYILFTIAIIIMGLIPFLFEYWFYLIIIVTAFTIADIYFRWLFDYEGNYIKSSMLHIKTNKDLPMLIIYCIGVLVAGLVAWGVSFSLNNFKPEIHNIIGVIIISVFMTLLVAMQIKSQFKQKSKQ